MPENSQSPALSTLPEDLQQEYFLRLGRAKEEVSPVEGLTEIHDMLLERYIFIYVAMRQMERDWISLDNQRYNQLVGLWIKLGADLLDRYRELYVKGALNDVFVESVMKIIVEEVQDPAALSRIRARLGPARKEASSGI